MFDNNGPCQDPRLPDATIDAVPDAVVIIRRDGTIGFVNRQTEKWFGYERQELFGKELEILIPERFREPHRHAREGFVNRPVPRPMGTGLELYGRKKDGSEFPVDITIGPVTTGGETFFVAIVRDISERRKIEAERNLALQAKEDLLAMITHDLKNPLTAIAISVELLSAKLEALGQSEEYSKVLRKLQDSASQMSRLVQDILTRKKIESGTFSVEFGPCDVTTLVNEVFETMEPIAARKSITLEKTVHLENSGVVCDRDRVKQVFFNLIDNAIKFTPSGGTIRLLAREDGGEVKLSVVDDGPGIPADLVPHLFNRYVQAKDVATRGTGLGLSIAKGIVETHGGKVWVETTPNKGSTFTFTLPTRPSAPLKGAA